MNTDCEVPRPICPVCKRDFIPTKCSVHCIPSHCKADKCVWLESQTKRSQEGQACSVCGKEKAEFVRFPADILATLDVTLFSHPRTWIYEGRWYFRMSETAKPRIHREYCSPKCYCHPEWGHLTKTSVGRRRRKRLAYRRFLDGKGNNPYGSKFGKRGSKRDKHGAFEAQHVRTPFGLRRIVPKRLTGKEWTPPEER